MVTDEDKQIISNILTQEVGTSVKIELVALDTVRESESAQDETEKVERKTPLMRRVEAQDDPQLKTALDLLMPQSWKPNNRCFPNSESVSYK
jgi:hypothetical protein